MSAHEVRVTDLIGRRVRDASGRSIGRIEELICEIEPCPGGRHHVMREFHIGAVGFLEAPAVGRGCVRCCGRGTRSGISALSRSVGGDGSRRSHPPARHGAVRAASCRRVID